jgi:hypothetical protein
MTQALIAAGVDLNAMDDNYATSIDLASFGSVCRDILEHHSASIDSLKTNPELAVSVIWRH